VSLTAYADVPVAGWLDRIERTRPLLSWFTSVGSSVTTFCWLSVPVAEAPR